MPEGDRQLGLTREPAVRYHSDEVLRGQRFKDRHEECNEVLVLGILRLEQKILMVQYHLTVHVFYQNPEGLRRTMDLPAQQCGNTAPPAQLLRSP